MVKATEMNKIKTYQVSKIKTQASKIFSQYSSWQEKVNLKQIS